jgi:hypothetical protein
MPLTLHTPAGRLSLISTLSVFGALHDIALSELATESFFPADGATAALLKSMHAAVRAS